MSKQKNMPGRPHDVVKVIPGRIKEVMKAKGVTPVSLADKINLSIDRTNHIIPAEYIGKDTLKDIGKALDVAPEYFKGLLNKQISNKTEYLYTDSKGIKHYRQSEEIEMTFPPFSVHYSLIFTDSEMARLILTKCGCPPKKAFNLGTDKLNKIMDEFRFFYEETIFPLINDEVIDYQNNLTDEITNEVLKDYPEGSKAVLINRDGNEIKRYSK